MDLRVLGPVEASVDDHPVASTIAGARPRPAARGVRCSPAFTAVRRSRLVATYASGRAYVWDIRPASLVRQACRVAGRRLTRAEWAEFLPGRAYEPAC